MTESIIEALRRAEGSEVLPTVLLGAYRADELMLKAAARLEVMEEALLAIGGLVPWPDSEMGYGDLARAAYKGRKLNRGD